MHVINEAHMRCDGMPVRQPPFRQCPLSGRPGVFDHRSQRLAGCALQDRAGCALQGRAGCALQGRAGCILQGRAGCALQGRAGCCVPQGGADPSHHTAASCPGDSETRPHRPSAPRMQRCWRATRRWGPPWSRATRPGPRGCCGWPGGCCWRSRAPNPPTVSRPARHRGRLRPFQT